MSNSSWMKDVWSKIERKIPREMCFPGTHDSGCFWLEREVIPCLAPSKAVSDIRKLNINELSDAMKSMAITQNGNKNILAQLNDGIRYFDFRVSFTPTSDHPDGSYQLHHYFIGPYLADQLNDLKNFMLQNDQEVVVVKSLYENGNSGNVQDNRESYITFLQQTLGGLFGWYSAQSQTSMSDLVKSGQRFLFAEGGDIDSSSYYNPYVSSDAMYNSLIDNYNKHSRDPNKLWEIQFVLGLSNEDYVLSVLGACPLAFIPLSGLGLSAELVIRAGSPSNLKGWVEQTIHSNLVGRYTDYVKGKNYSQFPNVLLADFYDETDVVEQAIIMSQHF